MVFEMNEFTIHLWEAPWKMQFIWVFPVERFGYSLFTLAHCVSYKIDFVNKMSNYYLWKMCVNFSDDMWKSRLTSEQCLVLIFVKFTAKLDLSGKNNWLCTINLVYNVYYTMYTSKSIQLMCFEKKKPQYIPIEKSGALTMFGVKWKLWPGCKWALLLGEIMALQEMINVK